MNLLETVPANVETFLNSRKSDREKKWLLLQAGIAPSVQRLHGVLKRHLVYAKAQANANAEKRAHGQDAPDAFDRDDFRLGLILALNAEYPGIFQSAADQLADEIAGQAPGANTAAPGAVVSRFTTARAPLLAGAANGIADQVQEVYDAPGDLTLPEIRQKIAQVFSDILKGSAIPSTEAQAAYGAARHAGMVQAGAKMHEWLCSFDNSREWHIEADGQTVPLGRNFIVKGEPMMHPGDPSASAANTVNCNCWEVPLFA
jgi:hypothetical protein